MRLMSACADRFARDAVRATASRGENRPTATPSATQMIPNAIDAAKPQIASSDVSEAHLGLVSVIIPTLQRPTLLKRALESVFRQSWRELEVIVVVDGPDPDTIAVLQTIEDPRLRVVQNPRSLTAAGARNAGVDLAKGEWIAFLDDDDEWMPEKLAKQLAYAKSRDPALITCLSCVVTSGGSFVRPQVIYDNLLPIDEYLFDRRSPFASRGFIQTSTYLLPRALCGDLRFRDDNPHDDWDFLLRLSKQRAVRVETVPEILARIYVDDARPSLSKSGTWLASLQWVERMRPLLTSRAYGSLCLGVVGPRAAKERAHRAGLLVLYRAFRQGSPRLWRAAAFLAVWLAPNGLTRRRTPDGAGIERGIGQ
jgi:glycosyltransferase involved in cell wall biosynthesis